MKLWSHTSYGISLNLIKVISSVPDEQQTDRLGNITFVDIGKRTTTTTQK